MKKRGGDVLVSAVGSLVGVENLHLDLIRRGKH